MNSKNPSDEACAVCGKELTPNSGASHVYIGGRRFSLCCPMCLDLFQRAPARFASGEKPRTIVDELLDDLKWRDP